MNAKLRKPSRWRRALTLIEVVASLTLLVTLLASILAAYGRLAQQARLSQERRNAVRQLDQLVAQWLVAEQMPPENGAGLVPAQDSLVWVTRTWPVPSHDNKWLASILRVEIRRRDASAASPPLASVELLVDSQTSKPHVDTTQTSPEVQL